MMSLTAKDITEARTALDSLGVKKLAGPNPRTTLRAHAADIHMHLAGMERAGITTLSPRVEVLWGELRVIWDQIRETLKDPRKDTDAKTNS